MATVTNVVRWADNTEQLKKNLLEGIGTIDAMKQAVDRTVQSLSGGGLFGAANKVTAAILEMGGTTKLTAAEQDRANAILEKAIEKYKTMGMTAPPAMVELAAATRRVEEPTNRVTDFMKDLAGEATKVATGFLTAQAVMRAGEAIWHTTVDFVKDSVRAYMDAEGAQVKLTAALRAQSLATPTVIRQYNEMATSFQRTTVFSDDLVNRMQALLIQVGGIMPSQMKAALQASTDLAAGLGIDLESATMLVAKAASGHTETLGRYGITVSKAALDTKGFDAVLESVNRQFGGQAAAQVDTYAGRVAQAENAWNNLQESVGKFVLENPAVVSAMNAIADALKRGDESSSGGLPLLISMLVDKIPLIDDSTALLVKQWALLSQHEDWMSAALDTIPGIDAYTRMWVHSLIDANITAGQIEAMLRQIDAHPQPFQKMADANVLPKITAGMRVFEEQVAADTKARAEAKQAAEAHAKALDEVNKKIADATRDVGHLTTAQEVYVLQLHQLGLDQGDIALKMGISAIAVKKYLAELDGLTARMAANKEATGKFQQSLGALMVGYDAAGKMGIGFHGVLQAQLAVLPGVTDRTGKLAGNIEELGRAGQFSAAAILKAKDSIATLPNVTAQATAKIKEAREETVSFSSSLTNILKGNVGKGLGGMFESVKKSLDPSQILNTMIGSGLSGLVSAGMSLAMKGVTALFGKMFGGPSKEELEGRKAVQQFEAQLAGMLTAQQKLEAGGKSWAMTTIAVRDAFLATGRTAAEAELIVRQLWDTKNPAAYKAAIDEINVAMAEQQADQTRAKELIQEYGISIEQLGPKFRQQQLNEQAKSVMNDFRLMVDVLGIAAPVAIDLMKDKINSFVQSAILTGSEVPANMQPMLQQMVDMGLLTDSSGTKITDLKDAGIVFAETFAQGVDRLVAKFDQLMEKLGLIPTALSNIPTSTNIDVNLNAHWNIPDMPQRDVEYAARGGLVTSSGVQYFPSGGTVLPFMPRGSDTVPAMLTPGEGILSRSDMSALGGAGGFRALRRSLQGGGGGAVDQQEVRATRLATERMARYFATDFKTDLARAVRDEAQKAR